MGIVVKIMKINVWYTLKTMTKSLCKHKILKLIDVLEPLESKNIPRYIVSMTSYGKRLADTAPYAIVTLLNQSVKPDKIVLWVANEDKENIPKIMEKLVEKGLEIRFCENIKSYKKLIPSLEAFPDDYIITADDDIYYPHNWFEQLLMEHGKNPKKIICHRAHGIKVDKNHNPLSYNEWDGRIKPSVYFNNPQYKLENVFPTGGAGTLYPPRCLYREVTNKELFMKLSPQADDIWFWAMTVINKEYFREESPYVIIENSCARDLGYIDLLQQLNGTALWNYNRLRGGNDIQFKAVIEHYPQIREHLRKIKPAEK